MYIAIFGGMEARIAIAHSQRWPHANRQVEMVSTNVCWVTAVLLAENRWAFTPPFDDFGHLRSMFQPKGEGHLYCSNTATQRVQRLAVRWTLHGLSLPNPPLGSAGRFTPGQAGPDLQIQPSPKLPMEAARTIYFDSSRKRFSIQWKRVQDMNQNQRFKSP